MPILGRWADSPYNPPNIKIDTGLYEVITDTLTGYTVDKVAVRKRDNGYVVQAAPADRPLGSVECRHQNPHLLRRNQVAASRVNVRKMIMDIDFEVNAEPPRFSSSPLQAGHNISRFSGPTGGETPARPDGPT
jgi:hypothetical protein